MIILRNFAKRFLMFAGGIVLILTTAFFAIYRLPGDPAHGPEMSIRGSVEVYVPTMVFDGRLSHHPTGAPAEDAPMLIVPAPVSALAS